MRRRFLILISTAIAVILVVGGILMVARKSRSKPKVEVARYPHQHLLKSEWEPAAKLPAGVYTLREGESLAAIAKRRYGHQNYYDLIKLHNHLSDAFVVAA